MPLAKKKTETVTFPLSVFETADTLHDLEDWLLAHNPAFIRRTTESLKKIAGSSALQ